MKRFVMEGTVEERLISVRRALAIDRNSTISTGLCGASLLDKEESRGSKTLNAKRRQRVEMMEKLFGCSKEQKFHKP